MKGLNVRVLAILVGTTLLLAIGVYVLHYFQMRNTAEDYLTKAQTLNKSEDLQERRQALRYYGQYLGQHPKDTDARAEMGMLFADLSEFDEGFLNPAFMCLEQVLREDDLRDDVRRKAVDLAMKMHQNNDAQMHLDTLQNHDPNNGELYELRARCQLAGKDYAAARRSYESAISYSPDLLEAYVGMANLLRAHGKYFLYNATSTQNNAEKDGPEKDAPDQENKDEGIEAKDDTTKKGDSQEDADNVNAAQENTIPENDPDYWINKMVERNPETARAYIIRAGYLQSAGQFEKAKEDVATALKLAPDDQDTLLMATRIAMEQKDYDQARKHAERAVKLFQDSPSVYITCSNLESLAGDRKKALEWLDKGLLETEQNPRLVWEKASILIMEGELDKVPSLIEQLRNSPASHKLSSWISYLDGQLAYAQKEWAKACSIFEGIITDLERISPGAARKAYFSLYNCYLKLNQPEMAERIRNKVQARTAAKRTTRVTAWKQINDPRRLSQVIAQRRKALQGDDAKPEGWVELTEMLIHYNQHLPKSERNWAQVKEAYAKAKELNPNHAKLPLLQAQLLLRQEKIEDAMKVLEEAVQHDPTNWKLWDPLVIMAQHNEEWDRAAKLLDEAEKHIGEKSPDSESDESHEKPEQSGKSLVAKSTILLARARLAVARDGKKASDELRRLGNAAEEMKESGKLFYLRSFATFALQAGDLELTKEYAQKVAALDPADLKIRMLLAEVAGQLQDEASMKRAVDEIGKIEHQGPLWHFYTARMLVVFDKSEDKTSVYREAINHLDQARLGRPGWPNVLMLLAEVHERMGDKSTAIENYRQAVELGSRDPRGLGNLARLLHEEGERDEARQILHMLDQTNTKLPLSIALMKGEYSLRQGDIEGGARYIEQVVDKLRETSKTSTDYRLFVELSRKLRVLGQIAQHQKQNAKAKEYYDEAENTLVRATELSPDTRELWIELVVLMANSGKIREVSDVLNKVKEKVPSDKVALTLAQCYEVLRRSAEAELQYEKAYQEDKDNEALARLMARFYLRHKDDEEKQKKGEAILRDMVNGKRPVRDADIPWARRQLTVLLSKEGSHQSYHEAMKLVEANLKQNPNSVLDKRLKARLLARRPSLAERKKALAIYEELVELPKPSPNDRYELARLYFSNEQWNKANQQMRPLMTLDRIKPEWLDFYIRAQIRAGEYSGAEAKLNRYESMVQDPFRIAVMRARILSGRGRHVRAIRVMEDYVDNASSSIVPRPTRVGRAAQALDNVAKHVTGPGRDAAVEQYLKLAEKYYREQAKADSSKTKLLISFLGRSNRHEEALQIAEEAWEKDPSLGIAVSAVALLSRGNPTPDETQRIEKIVDKAAQENDKAIKELTSLVKELPDQDKSAKANKLRRDLWIKESERTALLLTRAELLSFQKRYDEAEKLYRTVLAEDPDNIFALNNLAVFLSLRGLKIDEALQMINRAIELGGPTAVLLDSRATVNLAKGKWQSALDDMSMALVEEPTAIRFFHQAQAYAQGGKKREALNSMKSAENYGLKVENLQPLERPAYRQLKEDLQ